MRLQRGALFVAASFLVSGYEAYVEATRFSEGPSGSRVLFAGAWLLPALLSAAFLFAGILQLARAKPGTQKRKKTLAICLSYPAMLSVLGVLQLIFILTAPTLQAGSIAALVPLGLYATSLLMVLLQMIVCLVAFVYMRDVARRLKWMWFTVLSIVVFLIIGVLMVVTAAYVLLFAILISGGFWSLPESFGQMLGGWLGHFMVLAPYALYIILVQPSVMVVYWLVVAMVARSVKRGWGVVGQGGS